MRLMTYNLKGLHLSAAAAADVVRAARPDVLAVQEPPRRLRGVARMRRFGAPLGLVPVVSGHGARSTALLVRDLPVSAARAVRLSWRPGRDAPRRVGRRGRRDHRSSSSTSRSCAPSAPRTWSGCWPRSSRRRGRWCSATSTSQPDGPAWARLAEHLGVAPVPTGPTFPADAPVQRIDAVFATPDLVVTGASVPAGPQVAAGSDHRPIVVDLR